MPYHMIKRLILPDSASSSQGFIHCMRRGTFDCPYNFFKAVSLAFGIFERHKNHVYMVRHYHGNMQPHFAAIVMNTVFQDYVARRRRQFPSEVCAEGDEVFPA